MTYAGSFGLPRTGGLIILRQGEIVLRAPSDRLGGRAARHADESDLRGLLREVVAIRKAGKGK